MLPRLAARAHARCVGVYTWGCTNVQPEQESILPTLTGGLAFGSAPAVNVFRLYSWLLLYLFPLALSLSHDVLPLHVKIAWTSVVALVYTFVVRTR